MLRCMSVTQILMDLEHSDRVSDLTFEAVGINGSRTLLGDEVSGDCMLLTWEKREYVLSVDLSGCTDITDIGLSALGHGCSQLQMINLRCCYGITDIGISALGRGCSQLQTINLSCCQGITDIGVSALGDGCDQLRMIDLSECRGVSIIAVSALRLQGCHVEQ